MTRDMAVLLAAERWWAERRPRGWSQAQHIDDPEAADGDIGMCSAEECRLSVAVAEWVKERAEDTRR